MIGAAPPAGARSAELGPGRLAVRTRRVPGPPVVAIRAWAPGGARVERLPGLALVTGRALAEGTARRDWRRIADEAEARGAVVSSSASFEGHGVAIDALAADWELALEWAAELLLEPSFPEARCRLVARQVAAELESYGDEPEIRTAWAFLEQLYAPHPRSRPLQGTAGSLALLTPADCAAHHLRSLAGGVCVTVTGEIDEDSVATGAGEAFADLPAAADAPEPFAEPEEPRGLPERHRRVELPAGDQAHLYAGCLTIPRAHPDHEALELLGVVLGAGAGLTGRFPERVREREGLAYSVQVQTVAGAGLDRGRTAVYVGTAPATLEQAERAIVEELDRLLAVGPTEAEVAEARAYLLGREPFRHETARQWADLLGRSVLYGVPEDDPEERRRRLEAADRDAVWAAARSHLAEGLRVTAGVPAAG